MGSKTGIEWTDATWNPFLGCSRVSEGCRHCYAERQSGRFPNSPAYRGLTRITNGKPVWTGMIKPTKALEFPLHWRTPRKIFVNSMSDLFHENATVEMIDQVFAVMALAPQHTFQVLTKRPERMLEYLTGPRTLPNLLSDPQCDSRKAIGLMMVGMITEERRVAKLVKKSAYTHKISVSAEPGREGEIVQWPLPNVWLGVSVENQAAADERIPPLLQTPAVVRFISAEPLLGPLNIRQWLGLEYRHEGSYSEPDTNATICRKCEDAAQLDWVICGGESGPGARPMHPDWARSLRDQCIAAGVAFFFKQWGEWAPGSAGIHSPKDIPINGHPEGIMHRAGKKAAGSLLDGREWREFPGAPSPAAAPSHPQAGGA